MKLLFEHLLPPKLVKRLSDLYSNSAHVYKIGLDQVGDPVIWEHARTNDFVIVTKDADFTDLSVLHGFPAQNHLAQARQLHNPTGRRRHSPPHQCHRGVCG